VFDIRVKKKVLKTVDKMPMKTQKKFATLLKDLRDKGPIRTEYPNFSALGGDEYHCHLEYKWVACWKWEKRSIIIEVYYAGSRENAPY
jgi:mRNA-degrading endonuclease RelE of RelBE toxin-antitoxin system